MVHVTSSRSPGTLVLRGVGHQVPQSSVPLHPASEQSSSPSQRSVTVPLQQRRNRSVVLTQQGTQNRGYQGLETWLRKPWWAHDGEQQFARRAAETPARSAGTEPLPLVPRAVTKPHMLVWVIYFAKLSACSSSSLPVHPSNLQPPI